MTTTEMIKSLVGRMFRYMGDEYELMRVEPTVVLQSVHYGSCVELPPETFKRMIVDGSVKYIKEAENNVY